MEPFGLFQFLQSFLAQTPENANEAKAPDTSESEKQAEESAPKTNAEPERKMEADSSNQAILSFMQAHETRARRIKKL